MEELFVPMLLGVPVARPWIGLVLAPVAGLPLPDDALPDPGFGLTNVAGFADLFHPGPGWSFWRQLTE